MLIYPRNNFIKNELQWKRHLSKQGSDLTFEQTTFRTAELITITANIKKGNFAINETSKTRE